MRKHAFVDTMAFLHFKQLDEIDWRSLVGGDEIELLLAPAVWRELDRHKDQHPTPGLRERARTSVSKLRGWLSQGGTAAPIREGVTLRLLHQDPRIDFAAHSLAKEVPDDQLVATMIEYRNATADDVVLVTDDLLATQKAASAGFGVLGFPEQYRLETPTTEAEKKVKKLEDENRLLKSRLPDLRLTFASGQTRLEETLTPAHGWSVTHKTQLLQQELAKHPAMSVAEMGGASALGQFLYDYEQSVARGHNEDLDEHFERYSKYLDEAERYEMDRSRTVLVKLLLRNSGSGPASDIDVFLKADAPVLALEGESELMKKPKRPVRVQESAAMGFLLELSAEPRRDISPPPGLWDPSMEIRERDDGIDIEFALRKLKQGLSVELPHFWLVFRDEQSIAPFHATYRMNCEDRPQEQEGSLDFVIRRRI